MLVQLLEQGLCQFSEIIKKPAKSEGCGLSRNVFLLGLARDLQNGKSDFRKLKNCYAICELIAFVNSDAWQGG